MRRVWVVSVLAMAAAACGGAKSSAPRIAAPSVSDFESDAAEPAELRGTLVGHDGEPMPMAHVTVGGEATQVGEDGSFAIPLSNEGFERVMFTGVDHADHVVGVLLDGAPVELDVKLGTYPRPDKFDNVLIVEIDFKKDGTIALGKTVPMTAGDDGALTASVETNGDTFSYEIRGITSERGRSMNGTARTEFRYDGDGNYANVVPVEGGKVTVAVEPAKMNPASVATKVTFRAPDSAAARIAEVYEAMVMSRRFPELYPPLEAPALAERIAKESDDTVRGALMIAYLAVLPRPDEPGDEYSADAVAMAERVLDDVPSASPLWSMAPDIAARAAVIAGNAEKHRVYVEEVISGLTDDEAAAGTLFNMMWRARADGREDDVERYYHFMKDRFADTQYARLANMFDPNRRIKPGNEVPSFDLPAFDEKNKRYTDESFRGKTLLIDFWATWCGPCVEEMPHLHALHEKYSDKGFAILSVCVDDKADNVRKFRKKQHPMPWANVVLEGEAIAPAKEKFEVAALPTLLLVGPDGEILATGAQLRGPSLEQTLERLLD